MAIWTTMPGVTLIRWLPVFNFRVPDIWAWVLGMKTAVNLLQSYRFCGLTMHNSATSWLSQTLDLESSKNYLSLETLCLECQRGILTYFLICSLSEKLEYWSSFAMAEVNISIWATWLWAFTRPRQTVFILLVSWHGSAMTQNGFPSNLMVFDGSW